MGGNASCMERAKNCVSGRRNDTTSLDQMRSTVTEFRQSKRGPAEFERRFKVALRDSQLTSRANICGRLGAGNWGSSRIAGDAYEYSGLSAIFDTVQVFHHVCDGLTGSLFTGTVARKSIPHGLGIMMFEKGAVYFGEICDGHLDGAGLMTYADGSTCRYLGFWKQNKFHGLGTYWTANSDTPERDRYVT